MSDPNIHTMCYCDSCKNIGQEISRLTADLTEAKEIIRLSTVNYGDLQFPTRERMRQEISTLNTALAARDGEIEKWIKLTKEIGLKVKCLYSCFPDDNGHIIKAVSELTVALAARDVIIGDMREALEERISIEGTWQEWAEQVSIGQIKDFIQMIADATQRKIKDKALKGVVRG